MISEYDFKELKEKALRFNATQEDINNLGKWLELYGDRLWNGEKYEIDDLLSLKPIQVPMYPDDVEMYDEDGYIGDYETIGYEIV